MPRIELYYETKSGKVLTRKLPAIIITSDYEDPYLEVDEDNLTNSQERFFNLYCEQQAGFFDPFESFREIRGIE